MSALGLLGDKSLSSDSDSDSDQDTTFGLFGSTKNLDDKESENVDKEESKSDSDTSYDNSNINEPKMNGSYRHNDANVRNYSQQHKEEEENRMAEIYAIQRDIQVFTCIIFLDILFSNYLYSILRA